MDASDPPAGPKGTGARKLAEAVHRAPRLRCPLDPSAPPVEPTFLVGEPARFPAAIATLRDLGWRVTAALIAPSDIPPPLDVPVMQRTWFPTDLAGRAVFAGTPRKFQFTSCTMMNQRLCWITPGSVPKQTSRHADAELLARHGRALAGMWERLADAASRKTLAAVLASRLTDDNGRLHIAAYAEYAHPAMAIGPGDIVVDGGAHVGKVSTGFARRVGPSGRVYAFEPDPDTFTVMAERTKILPQVTPIRAGVWRRTTELRFDTTATSSAGHALTKAGDLRVPVVALDDVFRAEPRPPTVIKLDVEGAEAAALDGAQGLIRRHKPRLIVSVYHKPRDLWKLMAQIRALRDDYRFYLGHHNFYHTETDLYAV